MAYYITAINCGTKAIIRNDDVAKIWREFPDWGVHLLYRPKNTTVALVSAP